MAVELTTPVTTEAVEQKTFNEVWLQTMNIQAISPNAPVVVSATLAAARSKEDGSKELGPVRTPVLIKDFFALCQDKPALYQMMLDLVSALKNEAGI